MFRRVILSGLMLISLAASAPNKPVGDFDLNELMNKFLAEYETGNGNNNKNSEYEEHSQDIFSEPETQYEPEPHYYQPEPQHNQYHHHHRQQQQQQQFYNPDEYLHQQQHFQGQRNPSNQGFIKDGPSDQGYNRYQEQSTNVNSESSQASKVQKVPQKQTTEEKPSKVKENQNPAKVTEQQEEVDPKLRDFTLIISKLLFQLSQL